MQLHCIANVQFHIERRWLGLCVLIEHNCCGHHTETWAAGQTCSREVTDLQMQQLSSQRSFWMLRMWVTGSMRRSSPTLTSGIHWRQVAWHHSPGSVVGFRAPPSIGHRQHWGGLLSSCMHRNCEQGHLMKNVHDPRHALYDCLLCPCAGWTVAGSYSLHVTVL